MQNLFVAVFVVLALSFDAFARLAPIPLEELVGRSDIVLVGTLTDLSESRADGVNFGSGEIVVNEVVAGHVKTNSGIALKPGDRLELSYAETFACVYGSHKRIENEQVVWFLNIGDRGEITGEDFLHLAALPEIKSLARKRPAPVWPAKIADTENEPALDSPAVLRVPDGEEISFCTYDFGPRFYPFPAFLVVIGSISLYYLLYRSRFRIR